MNNPETLRLAVFLGVFILCSLLEQLFAYNTRTQPLSKRLLCNIGISVSSTLLLKALGFIGLAAFTQWVHSHNMGLLAALPFWLALALTLIVFDLAIYTQHVLTHRLPWLWRLHKVHHADRDLDVSSAIRFHPLEIAVSYFYKMALVLVLGPPVIALLIFEILLNASAMFNHTNIALPQRLEKWVARVVVTPTMHRVHHSTDFGESNSNYGFFFSFWDKLFGTYTAKDNALITLGLEEEQHERTQRLGWALVLPFKKVERPEK